MLSTVSDKVFMQCYFQNISSASGLLPRPNWASVPGPRWATSPNLPPPLEKNPAGAHGFSPPHPCWRQVSLTFPCVPNSLTIPTLKTVPTLSRHQLTAGELQWRRLCKIVELMPRCTADRWKQRCPCVLPHLVRIHASSLRLLLR